MGSGSNWVRHRLSCSLEPGPPRAGAPLPSVNGSDVRRECAARVGARVAPLADCEYFFEPLRIWHDIDDSAALREQRVDRRLVERRRQIDAAVRDAVVFLRRRREPLETVLCRIRPQHAMHRYCGVVVAPDDVLVARVVTWLADEAP